ncbi:MAG: hypothetical protein J0H07_14955 [Sphingobacteriales bacterium]|nr:hypothetical protein [Sphingobacteriales bacterium]
MPEGYNIERIITEHSSRSRNRNIAEVFFKACFIEARGRGIACIIEKLRQRIGSIQFAIY